MKKILTLFVSLILTGAQQLSAQDSGQPTHQPTYREVKEAGLLGNYSMDQIMEMQRVDALEARQHAPSEEQIRAEQPEPTHIQSTSSSFTISPLNPSICTGNTIALTVPTITSGIANATSDDIYSSTVSLGFSFTFYGVAYTQVKIGSNGVVTFNTGNNGNSWSIGNNEPSTVPTDMKNTIAVPWEDLYPPFGGTIKYGTVGTAPNRIFVAEWCSVPFYFCNTIANNAYYSGQVLLYESSNLIETHILNKGTVQCMSWNGSRAIHGTQNNPGTVASIVPGRNGLDGAWTTTNEGKRWTWNSSTLNYDITNTTFAPVGYLSPSTITWNVQGNPTVIGTGNSLSVSPTTTTTYEANITCSWCGGTITYVAASTVTVTSTLPSAVATSPTICPNTSTTLTGDCTTGCQWWNAATGGTQYLACGSAPCVASGVLVTPALSSTTTYWVTYTSGGCTPASRTAVTVTVGATLANPVASATGVCTASTPSSLTADCGANCEWYTASTGGTPVGVGSPFTSSSSITTYWVQTNSGGCTSNRVQVNIPIGNLNVTASSSLANCPTSTGTLNSTYSGAYSTSATQSNAVSTSAANQQTTANYCTGTSNPGNAVTCPTTAWRSTSIVAPAGVPATITSTTIKGVYFWLADQGKTSNYDTTNVVNGAPGGNPKAVGTDPRVWLKSPTGTYLLLTDIRPLNSDFATNVGNYCYCPTFTPAGTLGVLPNYDGPYNGRDYTPEGGNLATYFNGEATAGTWTLYVSDVVNLGGVHGGLPFGIRIRNFKIEFETWPAVSYAWAVTSSTGTCGTLSTTTAQSTTYTPPSPPASSNYSCTYTMTVTSGTCTGTQSVVVGCTVLPIELLSYTGTNTWRGNELKWVTATETNNSYFTLYRSRDAKTFDRQWKIQSKAINGNSTSNISYAFVDGNVNPGIYYYRLTQTDIDGTTKEVGTIPLTVDAGRYTLNVIPNPTTNVAEVTYECVDNQKAHLRVYDHSGLLIMDREIACSEGENRYTVDLADRADGIYVVTIATNDNVFKGRLIKSAH
jgi:hypothetical protein